MRSSALLLAGSPSTSRLLSLVLVSSASAPGCLGVGVPPETKRQACPLDHCLQAGWLTVFLRSSDLNCGFPTAGSCLFCMGEKEVSNDYLVI